MKDANGKNPLKKPDKFDKERILSTAIAIAVVGTLVLGIFSVVKNVKKSGYNGNIVDLNETQENVALKMEDSDLEQDQELEESTQPKEQDARLKEEAQKPDVDKAANKENITQPTKAETESVKETQPSIKPVTTDEMVAASVASYSFDENTMLEWPVTGDISLKFSMDGTTFYKTLGMYKCSPGIIIRSEAGTKVAAAASGIVTQVVESDETKTTLTVAVGNGYELTYGFLEGNLLKKGDAVTKGMLLGNVSEPSAYYKEEGPGLYFAVTKDGEPVDPEMYLEQ